MKHLSEFTSFDIEELARADVARALAEDVGDGDLTAALVDGDRMARARILARESAVICGTPWVQAAVHALDPQARLQWHVAEGQRWAARSSF
jgi:nicotinate-nucleotide pyrophosphorylase (carboxylating)